MEEILYGGGNAAGPVLQTPPVSFHYGCWKKQAGKKNLVLLVLFVFGYDMSSCSCEWGMGVGAGVGGGGCYRRYERLARTRTHMGLYEYPAPLHYVRLRP